MKHRKSTPKPGTATKHHPFAVKPKPFYYHPATHQKFEQKPLDLDCEYFDSELEFSFWMHLMVKFGTGVIIDRQHPIVYKPPTPNFGALFWKVDFLVFNALAPEHQLLFEVKGKWLLHNNYALSEFQHKYQFLEYVDHSTHEKLWVVDADQWEFMRGCKTINFDQAIALTYANVVHPNLNH